MRYHLVTTEDCRPAVAMVRDGQGIDGALAALEADKGTVLHPVATVDGGDVAFDTLPEAERAARALARLWTR